MIFHIIIGGPCGEELKDISAFPGDAQYEEGCVIYNQAYVDTKPAFVAFPETVPDVQKCLQCSSKHAVPCVVKSGGHSNSGYSTIDGSKDGGFVINLAKMNAISVENGTLIVQAGARWKNVYDKIDDLLVTGGLCPFAGVGGFTLGGGYSGLSRKYGLAVDNVVSMTMVVVNGDRVVIANDTVNTDLFWALRGGGGGNFGIVTDFTFKTHAADYSSYVLGSLSFDAGAKSQEALSMIGRINSQLPREMYLDISISSNKKLSVFPIFLGSSADAVVHLQPILNLASRSSFSNFSSYYSLAYKLAADSGYDEVTSGKPELARGCIIETLSEDLVEALFKFDTPKECMLLFMHLGGAISGVKPDETAYFYRSGEFDNYIACRYIGNEQKESVEKYLDHVYSTLEESGYCIGNYVNDMDRKLLNWKEKYYGANYQRLLEIKNKWNPVGSGYFHFPQEIGSNHSASRESVERNEL